MMRPVFDSWKGKPVVDIFMECRQVLEDMSFQAVRSWRQASGEVVGHFQVYLPDEIAYAAGMLRVKIRGTTLEPDRAN